MPGPTSNTEEQISEKENNLLIKKLKRNKSLGPDKIQNEMFIEADKETRTILIEILEQIHKTEEIPNSWEEDEIIRLYKGKGLKGKCLNERGITLAMVKTYMSDEYKHYCHTHASYWSMTSMF